MAASLIDLIDVLDLETLKRMKTGDGLENLARFENDCRNALEEDAQIEENSLSQDFNEKLEVLLELYQEKDPEIFSKLCNLAKNLWLKTPEFERLQTLMSGQFRLMDKNSVDLDGCISRLFTFNQGDLAEDPMSAIKQLDELYRPFMPQNIIASLDEFHEKILSIFNHDSMPLAEKLDAVATMYEEYHKKLSSEIAAVLYPSKGAGNSCSIESIEICDANEVRKPLGTYIHEKIPAKDKSTISEDSIKASLVNAYSGMCFLYINKKIGYGAVGCKHQEAFQFAINNASNSVMQNMKDANLKNKILEKSRDQFGFQRGLLLIKLRTELKLLTSFVKNKEEYSAVKEKLEREGKRSLQECVDIISQFKELFESNQTKKPSFINRLNPFSKSRASEKSKASDNDGSNIKKWIAKTEKIISEIRDLEGNINGLNQLIGGSSGSDNIAPSSIQLISSSDSDNMAPRSIQSASAAFRPYRSTDSQTLRGEERFGLHRSPVNSAPVESVPERVASSSSTVPVSSISAGSSMAFFAAPHGGHKEDFLDNISFNDSSDTKSERKSERESGKESERGSEKKSEQGFSNN